MPILSLKRNIISLYPISLYNNSITTFRWAPPLSGYWRPPKAGKNNHQANERGVYPLALCDFPQERCHVRSFRGTRFGRVARPVRTNDNWTIHVTARQSTADCAYHLELSERFRGGGLCEEMTRKRMKFPYL